jgi:hypothetical protein
MQSKNHSSDAQSPETRSTDQPEQFRQDARWVREQMFSSYYFACGQKGVLACTSPPDIQQYIDQYVLDATGSDCEKMPVLRSLIEQFLLLHHSIAKLQGDAQNSSTIENKRINFQLVANLLGEQRRLAESIESQIGSLKGKPVQLPGAEPEKKNGGEQKRTA